MAVQPRLTFNQVREYLKGRDGELTHVGGLTLDDLKRKFESNDAEMEKLRAERAEVKKRELADQLRTLKVEEAKAQSRRAQDKDEIERLHEEIAKLKEHELRDKLEAQRIRHELQNVDQAELEELERDKERELVLLAREQEALRVREQESREELARLRSRTEAEERERLEQQERWEGTLAHREEKSKHKSRREQRAAAQVERAQQHGERIARYQSDLATLADKRDSTVKQLQEMRRRRQRQQHGQGRDPDRKDGDPRGGSGSGKGAGEDAGEGSSGGTGRSTGSVDQRRAALDGQRRRVVELRAEVARARQADQAELRRGGEIPAPRPAGVNARLPFAIEAEEFLDVWLKRGAAEEGAGGAGAGAGAGGASAGGGVGADRDKDGADEGSGVDGGDAAARARADREDAEARAMAPLYAGAMEALRIKLESGGGQEPAVESERGRGRGRGGGRGGGRAQISGAAEQQRRSPQRQRQQETEHSGQPGARQRGRQSVSFADGRGDGDGDGAGVGAGAGGDPKLREMAAEMSRLQQQHAELAAVARRNTETSEHDHKQDAELRATQTRIAELERQHEERLAQLAREGAAHDDHQDAQLRRQASQLEEFEQREAQRLADLERKVSTPSAEEVAMKKKLKGLEDKLSSVTDALKQLVPGGGMAGISGGAVGARVGERTAAGVPAALPAIGDPSQWSAQQQMQMMMAQQMQMMTQQMSQQQATAQQQQQQQQQQLVQQLELENERLQTEIYFARHNPHQHPATAGTNTAPQPLAGVGAHEAAPARSVVGSDIDVDESEKFAAEQREGLRMLSMLPPDSLLHKLQLQHLEGTTRLHFETEHIRQKQQLEALKQELEFGRREAQRKLEQQEFLNEHKRNIVAARARKQLAAMQPQQQLGATPAASVAYDPKAGFAIFFDFLLGVPRQFRQLLLRYEFWDGTRQLTHRRALGVNECARFVERPDVCKVEAWEREQNMCTVAENKIYVNRKWLGAAPEKRLLVNVENVLAPAAGPDSEPRTQSIGWASVNIFTQDAGGNLFLETTPLKVGLLPPPADPTNVHPQPATGACTTLFLRIAHGAQLQQHLAIAVDPPVTYGIYKPPVQHFEPHPPSISSPSKGHGAGRRATRLAPKAKADVFAVAPGIGVFVAGAQVPERSWSGTDDDDDDDDEDEGGSERGDDEGRGEGEVEDESKIRGTGALASRGARIMCRVYANASPVKDDHGGASEVATGVAKVSSQFVSWNEAVELKGSAALSKALAAGEGGAGKAGSHVVFTLETGKNEVLWGAIAAPVGTAANQTGSDVELVPLFAPPFDGELVHKAAAATAAVARVEGEVPRATESGWGSKRQGWLLVRAFGLAGTADGAPPKISDAQQMPVKDVPATIARMAPPEPEVEVKQSAEEDSAAKAQAEADAKADAEANAMAEMGDDEEADELLEAELDQGDDSPWLDVARDPAATRTQLFQQGDGFDVYVDGARSLPDNCSISLVSAQVQNADLESVAGDGTTWLEDLVESDARTPVYTLRTEYRGDIFDPTATLVVHVKAVDRSDDSVRMLGYALHPIFTMPGKPDEQPSKRSQQEFVLNAGAFQLALHAGLPAAGGANGVLDATKLQSVPRVPCATVLLRVVPAPKAADGLLTLSHSNVKEEEWEAKGLLEPPPPYNRRMYISAGRSAPSATERAIYRQRRQREVLMVREEATRLWGSRGGGGGGDGQMTAGGEDDNDAGDRIMELLKGRPQGFFNGTFFAAYNAGAGFRVAVDGLLNVGSVKVGGSKKKKKLFKVLYSLSPPALFYGDPKLTDDVKFTQETVMDTPQASPGFSDGYQSYRDVAYDPCLELILDVWAFTIEKDGSFVGEAVAWAAAPVFVHGLNAAAGQAGAGAAASGGPSGGGGGGGGGGGEGKSGGANSGDARGAYVASGSYQLPLVAGAFRRELLQDGNMLSNKQRAERRAQRGQLIDGASVMLRLVDNQQHPGAWPPAHVSGTQSASGEGGAQPAQLNTQLIPQSQLPKCEFDRAKYDKAAAKAPVSKLKPADKADHDFHKDFNAAAATAFGIL